MRGRHLFQKPRGFTLVEMLVTLVIVTFITGLLWQAIQQIARIERLLQSSGSAAQRAMVRREWVRELIESAQPELVGDVKSQFRGDESSMSLNTGAVNELPGLGPGPLRLTLIHDELNRTNRLTVVSTPDGAALSAGGAAELVLMQWSGPAGRFQYLDDKGEWQARWPLPRPPLAEISESNLPPPQRPPRLVRIDMGDEAGGVLLAAVGSTEPPRFRLTEMEKM